jgi:hypothetical protein
MVEKSILLNDKTDTIKKIIEYTKLINFEKNELKLAIKIIANNVINKINK